MPGLESAIECRQQHIGCPVGLGDCAGAWLIILPGWFGSAENKMQAGAGQVNRHDRNQSIRSVRIRLQESPVSHGMTFRILDIG